MAPRVASPVVGVPPVAISACGPCVSPRPSPARERSPPWVSPLCTPVVGPPPSRTPACSPRRIPRGSPAPARSPPRVSPACAAAVVTASSPVGHMAGGQSPTDLVDVGLLGSTAGGLTPSGPSRDEIVAFGGIPDPRSEGRRMSSRLQVQPDVDDLQLGRAMRQAKLRDIEVTTGYLSGHFADPYVVATHSDGCQGAYGYWVYPVGDGSSGYLQPVWMAVM